MRDSVTLARFATAVPGFGLTLDVDGSGLSHGYAVRNPGLLVAVVILSVAASAPDEGTPPCPATCTVSTCRAARGVAAAPMPTRVSTARVEVDGLYRSGSDSIVAARLNSPPVAKVGIAIVSPVSGGVAAVAPLRM